MSPVIRGPQVVHKPDQTGINKPVYLFHITKSIDDSTIEETAENEVNLSLLQTCIMNHALWWTEWMSYFLNATAKHFAKPYTVQQIHKITAHALHGTLPDTFPAVIHFYPSMIEISGGKIIVSWGCTAIPIVIDIPDLMDEEEKVPVNSGSMEDTGSVMQEVNVDDLPTDSIATEALTMDHSGRVYDKQKLKEARLKAKIAMYKVQHQMARYYEKYGTEASDSDGDWTDESDSERSEEIVQL